MSAIPLQFSKNGALPLIYLALVSRCASFSLNGIDRRIVDVDKTLSFLTDAGILRVEGSVAHKTGQWPKAHYVDGDIFETRYSIYLASLMIKHLKQFSLPKPGGCSLGSERAVDYHAIVFKAFGFELVQRLDTLLFDTTRIKAPEPIALPYPSVGATLHAILLAVGLQTAARIDNAALEPEIANVLANLGPLGFASHTYERCIEIWPAGEVQAFADLTNIPDRIELGTLIFAAIAHRRCASFKYAELKHIEALLEWCEVVGCKFGISEGNLHVDARDVHAGDTELVARPFPGFPTDLQPIAAAAMATINGTHIIKDTVFPLRFDYAPYFQAMGVTIRPLEIGTWMIGGGKPLQPGTGSLPNIRSTVACFILQRLTMPTSNPDGFAQIKRGYADLISKIDSILSDDLSSPYSLHG